MGEEGYLSSLSTFVDSYIESQSPPLRKLAYRWRTWRQGPRRRQLSIRPPSDDNLSNFSYRNRLDTLEIRQTSGTTEILQAVGYSSFDDFGGDKGPPSNSFTSRVLVRCCWRMMLLKLPRGQINYASTVQHGAAISDKGASDNPRSALPKWRVTSKIRSHYFQLRPYSPSCLHHFTSYTCLQLLCFSSFVHLSAA